jgi:hypothetical protein
VASLFVLIFAATQLFSVIWEPQYSVQVNTEYDYSSTEAASFSANNYSAFPTVQFCDLYK